MAAIGVLALVAVVAGAIGHRLGQRVVLTLDSTETHLRDLREYGAALRDIDLCGVSYYGTPECDPHTELRGLVRLAVSAHEATPSHNRV